MHRCIKATLNIIRYIYFVWILNVFWQITQKTRKMNSISMMMMIPNLTWASSYRNLHLPNFSDFCERTQRLTGFYTSTLCGAFLFVQFFPPPRRIISNLLEFIFSATFCASVFVCCGCGMILFRLWIAALIYTFGARIFLVRVDADFFSCWSTKFATTLH